MSSPHLSVQILNSVVDVILETGNFSVEDEQFHFDVCNLDQITVAKIENVLKLWSFTVMFL